jgi:hypothetical protein
LYRPNVPMRKRIMSAVWALIINVIVWIVIPYYVGTLLATSVPQSALTVPSFVYEFGAMFIILDVGAAFFQGKGIAVPFISGAALLSVVYIWLVTNGGDLTVNASGISLGLGFQLLLYVLVLPSIWAAIRAPLSYFVWKRAYLKEGIPAAPVKAA